MEEFFVILVKIINMKIKIILKLLRIQKVFKTL